MKSLGYHFYDEGQGLYKSSRQSDEHHLIINCSGNFITDRVLNTNCLGRLDYYFLFVMEGNLILHTETGDKNIGAGSYMIIPPSTPYSYEHKVGDRLLYFWVHFTGRDAKEIIEKYSIKQYPDLNFTSDTQAFIAQSKKFTDICASEECYKESELAILFERMLLMLARNTCCENNLQLKKSISYINSSYVSPIKIPELARMEGLSVSRYNTLFKQIMNMTPTEYIIKARLSFACELLRSTDLAIKEISLLSGYDDAHFFSRIFRANIGVSPMEYRNKTDFT